MEISQIIEQKRNSGQKVRIELGCGPNKKEGFIGIDFLQLPGVDHVANLEEGLSFLADESIDEITSSHVLEHIENFEFLMREIHRVLKHDGTHSVVVPYFSNPWYYSDHTHKRFFALYSFEYFAKSSNLRRKVPGFYHDFHFEVKERKLIFKSPHFPIRNLLKQFYMRLFNLSPWMQEWYEESWCYAFPCQEIRYTMKPVK